MPLFQRPPSTPEELERSRPTPYTPEQVLQMDEATWYREVYRGEDVPQLTIRAVLMGSGLGFLLAFTNLYVGLMTGWALGVAITAAILSFALWSTLQRAGLASSPLTILETNCMASTASSAGYATGSTMVSAIPAMLLLTVDEANPGGRHLAAWVLLAWTGLLGVLGTCIAIPMKRSMINRERLPFPSGTAAAVTLRSLYSEGAAAMQQARSLLAAGLYGAMFPPLLELAIVSDGKGGRKPILPPDTPIFDLLPGPSMRGQPHTPSEWTMVLDHNPVMVAAGAIVGLRIAVSMVLGGLLLAFVVGPYGGEQAWTNPLGETVYATSAPHKAWKEIGIWFGVPIMVAASLLQFAMQGKAFVRALQGLRGGGADVDPRAGATEVPFSWFLAGSAVGGLGVSLLGAVAFDIPFHYGLLAVLLTGGLALVACRATGESDITPIGGMGKLMQLTYGVLIPQSTTANLMTASITSNCAGSAADLLSDLKSGYLLGANPRRQFLAQLSGVVSGTLASTVGFFLLVPDATVLTGVDGRPPRFPAPSAQAWKAVAEVFRHGVGNMHPVHQYALVVGVGIGVVLVLLETLAPKAKSAIPSATGLSLGMILPFQYPVSMLLGATLAFAWQKAHAPSAEKHLVPVSSGVIAGASILGVVVAILNQMVLPLFLGGAS